jgi:predicted DNA-binding transcriptional regulator YafY
MRKSNRLIYEINLIRNNRSLNAERIADICGVTARTVYRDIIELSEANIPVYYDRGYKLATNTFMPPLNFDVDEFLALRIALANTELRESSPYGETVRRAEAKIVAALNGSIPTELKTRPLNARLQGKSTDCFTASLVLTFRQLELAIEGRQQIEIDYQPLSGQSGIRRVDPYYIVFRRHAFYLIGFCHKRTEYRTFRIGRIRGLTLLDRKFTRDGRFSLESYFQNAWEIFTGPMVVVEVKFTGSAATVITTGRHHDGETVKRLKNGDVLYRVTTAGIQEIGMWLKQFGAEASVIKPPELRDELREFYQRAVREFR